MAVNLLPNRFEELLRDWVARAKQGRATYLACKQAYGVRVPNARDPVKALWDRSAA